MEKSPRQYLPTFAELADRMSICILKAIFIPENKESYYKEISDIMHDLDCMCEERNIKLNSEVVKSLMVIMLSNRYIWENESSWSLIERRGFFIRKCMKSYGYDVLW